mgnify:CR=1 FL=1
MSSPFVPIADVAKHYRVSQATIRSWLKEGVIPKHTYIHIGSTYRFNLVAITEALTAAEDETIEPTTWNNVKAGADPIPPLETDEDY